MKVVIEFNADTAAFEDDFSNCLLHIMDQIHDKTYEQLQREEGCVCDAPESADKILDTNGNTIGTIRVENSDDRS